MAERGLGKGLDALISDDIKSTLSEQKSPKVDGTAAQSQSRNLPAGITVDDSGCLWVATELLVPNPQQPRTEFSEEALQDLAQSLRENGVLQPIIIEDAGNGTFYIIAGERRTRAARLAGLEKVPVHLRRFTEQKKLEVALIENIQRENLNPIEEAQAYANLMQLGNFSQDEVAQKVGKKRSTVANAVRLLKLPVEMRQALVAGQISSGHARALLSVLADSDRTVLFGKIIRDNISVREAERLASHYNDGGRASAKKTRKKAQARDPNLAAIEQQFIHTLGTKCSINGTLSRGKIEIEFFSRTDLDRLYEILAK